VSHLSKYNIHFIKAIEEQLHFRLNVQESMCSPQWTIGLYYNITRLFFNNIHL